MRENRDVKTRSARSPRSSQALSRVPPIPLSHRKERGVHGYRGTGFRARWLSLVGVASGNGVGVAPSSDESPEVCPVSPYPPSRAIMPTVKRIP